MVPWPRQMNLCLFFSPGGYHRGAWRNPGSRSDELLTFKFVSDVAQQAERAKLDAIFLADALSVGDTTKHPTANKLEPLTTLAALSTVTSKIGLIATASTSFTEPYNLARYFGSIDHLSGGRVGWNIVTSFLGAENFNQALPDHDERYSKAFEYVEIMTALWDSWQDDAVVNDKEGGAWSRPDRIRSIDFNGKYYRVAGPLNMARSPQGWPVLVQAGSSDTGMDFAATYAETIFTAQSSIVVAKEFYSNIKAQVARKGRDPRKVKVLPGLMPIIGDTEAEAQQLADEIANWVDLDDGRDALSLQLNHIDLNGLDLDRPIPRELMARPEEVQGGRSRYAFYYGLAVDGGYTLRELIKVRSVASGHSVVIGSAEQVADAMERWLTEDACDGFNLQPPHLMGGLDAITDQLIPILQERGSFHKEYEGTTLRDHLGLVRPPGRTGA